MQFIVTEDAWSRIATWSYRGVIGLFFNNTLTGILCYLIFALMSVFTVVGIYATIKHFIEKAKKKSKSNW